MNSERAKELLPIYQAYAEGKQVEWLNTLYPDGGWYPETNLSGFGASHIKWRIKPEKKTGWIVIRQFGELRPGIQEGHFIVNKIFSSQEEAQKANQNLIAGLNLENIAIIPISYEEGEGL